MHHKEFENLLEHAAIFKKVAEMLEQEGLEFRDGADTASDPWPYAYYLHIGNINIGGKRWGDFEKITFYHRLCIGKQSGLSTRVSLMMSFYDANDEGPTVYLEHWPSGWRLVSDSGLGDERYAHYDCWSSSHSDLLGLLNLNPADERTLTDDEAMETIRLMAEFWKKVTANDGAHRSAP